MALFHWKCLFGCQLFFQTFKSGVIQFRENWREKKKQKTNPTKGGSGWTKVRSQLLAEMYWVAFALRASVNTLVTQSLLPRLFLNASFIKALSTFTIRLFIFLSTNICWASPTCKALFLSSGEAAGDNRYENLLLPCSLYYSGEREIINKWISR